MCPKEGTQGTSQQLHLAALLTMVFWSPDLMWPHTMASLEGRPQLLGNWPGDMVAKTVVFNHVSSLGGHVQGKGE